MKKFFLGLACGMTLTAATAAYASDAIQARLFPVKYVFDGQPKELDSEYTTLNVNGHAYVPIRWLSETMGALVGYDGDSQTIWINSTPTIPYENETGKFGLSLPSAWGDQYAVEEFQQEEILTYHFRTTIGRGELFRVEVWPKQEWETQGVELAKIIHISKIGELGNRVYAFATPTDVQYDHDNQRDKEQYLSLARDLGQIKASFTIGK